MHSRKKIIIHSTNTPGHGAYFLLNLIDAAIWLMSHKKNLTTSKQQNHLFDVQIILHPVVDKFGFFRFLSVVKNNWLNFFKKNKSDQPIKNHHKLYETVFKTHQNIEIETGLGSVFIKRSHKRLGDFVGSWFVSYFYALKSWLNVRRLKGINGQKFLNITHRQVVIGDLIASYALRKEAKQAGGSIHFCPKLFQHLVNAMFIAQYIEKNINIGNNDDSFVIVAEKTYLHAIYSRLLHKKGSTILDKYNYKYNYRLIEPGNNKLNYQFAQYYNKPLTDHEIVTVETYLNERITDPVKHLWYMRTGHNRTDESLLDENNNEIFLLPDKIYAVVFFHSFDDAQYGFGNDGFDDIYHWTDQTIEHLLANNNIENVLIKKHPNTDMDKYPGNATAIKRLVSKYAANPKAIWIQPDTSLKSFTKTGKFIGFTHHGSVAEELVHLKVPVVASRFSPYGKNYNFGIFWSSPKEYFTIIANLSLNSFPIVDKKQTANMHKYVYERRINALNYLKKQPWKRYLDDYYFNNENETYTPLLKNWDSKLKKICINDKEFKLFINDTLIKHSKNIISYV